MDPYASEEQIERLTRRKYAPAQCRRLDERGIPYITDAAGKPLVLLANLPDHTARDRLHHDRPRFDQL